MKFQLLHSQVPIHVAPGRGRARPTDRRLLLWRALIRPSGAMDFEAASSQSPPRDASCDTLRQFRAVPIRTLDECVLLEIGGTSLRALLHSPFHPHLHAYPADILQYFGWRLSGVSFLDV